MALSKLNNDSFADTAVHGQRNLIINGAMTVAQRGTSSTTSGFGTVDRFETSNANNDEAPTQAQHALTSSDTGVYEKGFRNSYHITNGNQTSGAGADDRVTIQYNIEAQDIAKSGWDYTSSSSYITLSFYCKSSVAQNFYGRLQSQDGTQQGYAFETGSLSADTWTKVTKIIPGDSDLTFNNDNNSGMLIEFVMFRGTAKTGTMTLDAWDTWNTSVRVPDMTSTWYTTNDATFEITGVQLEVGDKATPFEHRSYGDELARCQRYYQKITGITSGNTNDGGFIAGTYWTSSKVFAPVQLNPTMRIAPTMGVSSIGNIAVLSSGNSDSATGFSANGSTNKYVEWELSGISGTGGNGAWVRITGGSSNYIDFDAEL